MNIVYNMDCMEAMREMPEKEGEVLIFTTAGWVYAVHYSSKHKLFNAFDFMESAEAKKNAIECTHWMPLPEPPKESKDG